MMMNTLPPVATIERISVIEGELQQLRAEAYLRAGIPVPARHERIARMVDFAATLFRTTSATIAGPVRSNEACRARFAVMWAARQAYGESSVVIGRELGNRDHTSVLNAWKRAEIWRAESGTYRDLTNALVEALTPKTEEAAYGSRSH